MTAPLTPTAPSAVRPQGGRPLARLVRRPPAVAGALWLAFIVIASLTAPLWLPYPTEQQDFSAVLAGPSPAHWLGTDELGRDLLSRIFAAGGGTLAASTIGAVVAMLVAVPLALIAASGGERVEGVINRVTEVMLAIPAFIIMLAVIGVVGTNMPIIMAIFGFLISSGMYRVFVGAAKSLQAQLYVDAASVDGIRPVGISLKHVLPGMLNTVMVQFALVFAVAIMLQAGLAFIGFGPPIPQPSWGGMIQAASQHVYDAPWMMVPTGIVLALTVLSANVVADALAATTDVPQLQIALREPKRRMRAGASTADTQAAAGEGLRVRALAVGSEAVTLVSDVSLDVRPGRVLGLVGESGCGKTLTALSLIGLLPPGIRPQAGEVLWNGHDLTRLSEREFMRIRGREIALISQEPMRALDPMFTVGYQLGGAIRRLQKVGRAAARAEAAALLGKVGIVDAPTVLRLYPHEISGGMAQRVAIALALAGRPRLLVADEPTTALDVTVQAEILDLLRSIIADTGMSMVLVTHDFGVVADICDDVVVMYAGEVVESGSVHSVLEGPQHPYAMALLAADPHAGVEAESQRLASIPGQVPQPKDWPDGCRFADRCRFSTEACRRPIALTPRRSAEGEVRCIRSAELTAAGVTWAAAPAGVEPERVRIEPERVGAAEAAQAPTRRAEPEEARL
ncbi:dipeptide/oligopeptide/nickel ABC transporter permease/ATP-binding protein [Microbacterium sp. STN6]|uniref:dipeptide/oligopeptide/nickel ABC transporter permease/ATP-binding protein n=1 Tax=Microbacterium sp. STN6 TaxID=2995588 RepID=UPI002260DDEA|nr:dipeptide/oligopeptide/nickel ABC transporter permease/ATP-binding protein [Microbacterium sp. STN6]MCX7520762.1 dipeptide/oligopeptide/nickel ABC transporter permease/ATP-binding protein [Microbacterium sp. STN6]